MTPSMRFAAAACLVCALAASARAQAPGETAPIAPAPAAPVHQKDPSTALLWSLGGTAAGLGLWYAGAENNNDNLAAAGFVTFTLGPSFGQWYAGKVITPGLGARAVGFLVFVVGVGEAVKCIDGCSNGDGSSAGGLMLLGGVVYTGGMVYDIATAPGAARDWNNAHAGPAFTPTALPAIGGPAPGIALTGAF